jgi:hypothetical protein
MTRKLFQSPHVVIRHHEPYSLNDQALFMYEMACVLCRFDLVHLCFHFFDCEPVHEFDSLGSQLRLFIGSRRFINVDLF